MGKGIVLNRGEGGHRWFFGGGVHEWKATAAETGGSLFAFEDVIDGEKLTPLHHHPEADEVGLVLEGEVELYLDGEVHRVESGGFYFIPRGTPHGFRGVAPQTRLFALQTPGGGDAFYLQASEETAADAPDGRLDFEALGAAATATGSTVIMGPPPFDRAPSLRSERTD
jgi:quercetin dioxygenase-like cupin family protein